MKKYRLKKDIADNFHNNIKVVEFSKRIGITRQTLFYIVNKRSTCNYPLAFTITKTLDSTADVCKFFEEI